MTGTDVDKLREELRSTKKELKETKKEKLRKEDKLENEKLALSQRIEELERALTHQENRKNHYKSEAKTLSVKLEQLTAESTELEKEKSSLKDENKDLANRLEESSAEVLNLQDNIAALKKRKDHYKNEATELSSSLQQVTATNTELVAAKSSLEKKNEDLKAKNGKQEERITELESTNAKKDGEVKEAREKIDEYKTKLNTANEQIRNLESSLIEYKDRIAALEEEEYPYDAKSLGALEERIEVLEGDKNNLIREKDEANQMISQLREQLTQAENRISILARSVDKKPDVVESAADSIVMPEDKPNGVHGKLSIDKVVDVDSDKIIDSYEFFKKKKHSEVIAMRRTLQEAIILDKPKYICYYCGQMVKLAGNGKRGVVAFFSHLRDSDDCDCKTTTGLTKAIINARKYQGQPTSERHKYLEGAICEALTSNVSIQKGIHDVKLESTVFGDHPLFKWRKPDIYFRYHDIEVVMEVQLSAALCSVVAEREMFYRMKNIFIIWVLNFEENSEYVNADNLIMKEIYYNNRGNAFFFDTKAQQASVERGELVLTCRWLNNKGQWSNPEGQLVTLSELKYDKRTYKPYYHEGINAEDSQRISETEEIVKLLDARYEREQQRKKSKEYAKERLIDALDIDKIDKEYLKLKMGKSVKDGLYGLVSIGEGKEILPPEYKSIHNWHTSGIFKLCNEKGLYGLCNSSGQILLPLEYGKIPKTADKSVLIDRKNPSTGLLESRLIKVNADNNIDLSEVFCNLELIQDKFYVATKHVDGKYKKGLVDLDGKIVIDTKYDSIIWYANNLFVVESQGHYGIVNTENKIILDIQYDKIGKLEDGKAKVLWGKNKGEIDDKGHLIVQTSIVVSVEEHTRKDKTVNGWLLCNEHGKSLSDTCFDEIAHYQGSCYGLSKDSIGKIGGYKADKACSVECVMLEKKKKGLLFKLGQKVVRMNNRQRKKDSTKRYEQGKIYNLYISFIREDDNMIYLSPIPTFGAMLKNPNKQRPREQSRKGGTI